MDPTIITENGCRETYYGTVKMPHYAGVKDQVHQVTAAWNVCGVLPDGRVFEVFVKTGFTFDGCSIPRLLWRLCGDPFEVPRISAALAHDWLYAAHVCDKSTADDIFATICEAVGIGRFRRGIEGWALSWFGGPAWRSHGTEDNIYNLTLGSLWLDGELMKGE